MAKIFVYGPSGWGKSASLRNLPPEKTAIVCPDRKALPIAGWRKKYVTVTKSIPDGKGGTRLYPDWSKSNYLESGNPKTILDAMTHWEKDPRIEYIALDTITHMMGSEFMRRILDKGFDKFSEMGKATYDILNFVRDAKKNYAIFAHNEVALDAEGNKVNKVRSFGKLLDEKTEMPSMFTTVLVPVVKRGENKVQYMFQTQSDSYTFAKSPARFKIIENEDGTTTEEAIPALPFEVPNDLKLVFDLLDKFENEE